MFKDITNNCGSEDDEKELVDNVKEIFKMLLFKIILFMKFQFM